MADEKKNEAASKLAKLRWKNTSKEERTGVGEDLAAARWAGHVAKRPASSRNTGKPRGRPRKNAAVKPGKRKGPK